MKVLQIISSLSSGGAEVFVAQLTTALNQYCDVKLLTYAGELDAKGESLRKYLSKNNIDYRSFEARSIFKRVFLPLKFASEIKSWKPDIVHVHLTRSEQFIYLSSLLPHNNYMAVRTKHDERPYPPFILNSRMDDFFVFNIACSDSAYEPFKYLNLTEKTIVIKNGIEINKSPFLEENDINKLKSCLSLPLDKKILITIGSMHHENAGLQKAQDIIIEAISEYELENDIHFIFLGAGSAMSVLQRQVDDLGLNDAFSFKGIVPNVHDYLSCSDIMIMPSRWEGLPIAAIEAACSGLPMIVSDIDSFKEFNTKSVIKCKPDSVSSLGESITIALKSLSEYKNEAKRSLKRYQNIFSIVNVAKKHINLYNTILRSES